MDYADEVLVQDSNVGIDVLFYLAVVEGREFVKRSEGLVVNLAEQVVSFLSEFVLILALIDMHFGPFGDGIREFHHSWELVRNCYNPLGPVGVLGVTCFLKHRSVVRIIVDAGKW